MTATGAEIGSDVGGHSLIGLDGDRTTLRELAGPTATAVVFIGNGCPTVRSYEGRLVALQTAWRPHGVNIVAVNSNNPFLSPPDTTGEMAKRAKNLNFPYVKDENSELAKRLGAICTPHAFLFDADLRLVYSGRIDDSRVGDKITSQDLENAVATVVDGRAVAVSKTEPFGCSIVW